MLGYDYHHYIFCRLKVVRPGSCDKVLNKEFWRDEQIIPITDVTKPVKPIKIYHNHCENLPSLLSNLSQHFRTKLNEIGKNANGNNYRLRLYIPRTS